MNKRRVFHYIEPFNFIKDWLIGISITLSVAAVLLSNMGCAHIRQDQKDKDATYVDYRLSSLKFQVFSMTNDYRVLNIFDEFRRKLGQDIRGRE